MHIAIVHYHLSPGGVTSVIRDQSQLLREAGIPHVILCGRTSPSDLPVRTIQSLDYLRSSRLAASDLLAEMRSQSTEALGTQPDIWHFHNHSLGKNILFPEIVALLADGGEKIVLHIHDLVEDGRPGNHPLIASQPKLYPFSPDILYAFINPRDRDQFIRAGLPPENAIHLPNRIPPSDPLPTPEGPPLILYPSRSIRRKNIGELLLLAALSPEGTRFAITRAPENPEALAIHNAWQDFALKHRLPVEFSVVDRIPPHPGSDASFPSWQRAATHFITTSVAEGSGLVFLEFAASAKPLIGRNLPTNPFPGGSSLYQKISIPSTWFDPDLLRLHLTASLTETHQLYGLPLDPSGIGLAWHSIHDDGHLDFANLPEPLQKQAILKILSDPSALPFINGIPARQWIADILGNPATSLTEIRQPAPSLISIYSDLVNTPNSKPLHLPPSNILRSYLTPENFHFLLTAPPRIRTVIFDIYGTLLIAPPGAVRHDPAFDPTLIGILESFGHTSPPSPTLSLHEAVLRHHSISPHPHPEIDLRILWQKILGTTGDLTSLVQAIEDAWHPSLPMPAASDIILHLSRLGLHLGLLSNAQSNTLPTLTEKLGLLPTAFDPQLTILSYRHLIAKPSPALFSLLASRLASRGIAPHETLFVGNDPLQDILPAARTGFRTALFTGHPDSLRPGDCEPDLILNSLSDLQQLIHNL